MPNAYFTFASEVIHSLVFAGRILNVETQEMKFHEWGVGVDPDESCWVDSVKFNLSFLVCVRVFYEVGHTGFEEIGTAKCLWLCIQTWFVSRCSFSSIDLLWRGRLRRLRAALSRPGLAARWRCALRELRRAVPSRQQLDETAGERAHHQRAVHRLQAAARSW